MAPENMKLSSTVTVARYLSFEATNNRAEAGRFLRERFDERYFGPMLSVDRKLTHGFAMMAIACLAIEALQAFRDGKTTRNGGEKAFAAFFRDYRQFAGFAGSSWFYNHIRCGLLHEAQARGGWRILRSGPLLDTQSRAINAARFIKGVQSAVNDYSLSLEDEQRWEAFKKWMLQVLKNCEPVTP